MKINRNFLYTGLRWLWLALLILMLDFSSKQWIMKNFILGSSIPVFPFINICYVHNYGMAFSLMDFANSWYRNWQRWILVLIAIVSSLVLLVNMYRSDYRDKLSNIAYALMIGGTLGNLYDRITYGVVIDFLDLYLDVWHCPIFNLADLSICIGAALIFFMIHRI